METIKSLLPVTWSENVSIFLDNLCLYHICFDLISFLAIVFTWWFCRNAMHNFPDNRQTVEQESQQGLETSDINTDRDGKELDSCNKLSDDGMSWCDSVSQIKIMRQKALTDELKSKLTEDELQQEKETEKMQLEKIFQLLREQEDKFQVSSIEEVKDQMNLYKI